MALPQDRYVKITSTNIGDSIVAERDLCGLVFTKGKGWKGTDPMDPDSILVCYSVDQAKKYFSSDSGEVQFATRYFSYLSPSGTCPLQLSFARVKVTNSDGDNLIWKITSAATATSVTATLKGVTGTVVPKGARVMDKTTGYVYTLGANVTIAAGGTEGTFACTTAGAIACAAGDLSVIVSKYAGWTEVSNADAGTTGTDAVRGWCKKDSSTAESSYTEEAPADALTRINLASNNFGSFCLVDADYKCKLVKDVMVQNSGYNYKYLFALATVGGKTGIAADDTNIGDVSTQSFIDYLDNEDGYKGTVLVHGDSVFSAEMPMTIFAATDYDGVNTATYQMFKQFDGETATVTDESYANAYDAEYVNYYGLVQINGRQRAFYQRGVNSDGENTAVYCNEIWLKSHISTAIMDLLLSVERIPSNEDGELMIYTVITGAAEKGLNNGVIEKGKTLTDNQKMKIYQLTGDSEAWFSVQQAGYIAYVTIEADGNEYKAHYKLIYSKGDSICCVEGQNVLV